MCLYVREHHQWTVVVCVCACAGSCPQCAHFFLLQMQLLLDTEEVVVVFRQPPPLLPLPLPLHLPRGDALTLATAHRCRPDSDPAATPARALSLQPWSVQVDTHKHKHTQCLLKSPGPRAYTSHVLLNSTFTGIIHLLARKRLLGSAQTSRKDYFMCLYTS